jgi:hypothetical protein
MRFFYRRTHRNDFQIGRFSGMKCRKSRRDVTAAAKTDGFVNTQKRAILTDNKADFCKRKSVYLFFDKET